MSYPGASVALLDGLREVTGISIGAGDLAREADIQRARIDQLVAGNDEHGTMVRQLEAAYDAFADEQGPAIGTPDLPSGDDIAAEFERFLRDQDD
jgi:hypothetical protein